MTYRILVLDTETTGFSPSSAQMIEVAASMFCTLTKTTLASVQFLIPTDEGNPQESVNHISDAALRQPVVPGMIDCFLEMYASCDCVIAHNVSFDRPFVMKQWPTLPDKPWICSLKQLTFPNATKSLKLNHLAVDHGISPVDAHRALGDVIVLVRLLSLVKDLDSQISQILDPNAPVKTRSASSLILFEAHPSDYGSNEMYKAAGFKWTPDVKKWRKKMERGTELDLPFSVRLVESSQPVASFFTRKTGILAVPP